MYNIEDILKTAMIIKLSGAGSSGQINYDKSTTYEVLADGFIIRVYSYYDKKLINTYFYNLSGNLHNSDGPAFICEAELKKWYKNGKLHRIGKPAIECKQHKEWYKNDKLHRIGKPAIENFDGRLEWWVNGKRHCKNGPAIVWKDGNRAWFINGKILTKAEFEQRSRQ